MPTTVYSQEYPTRWVLTRPTGTPTTGVVLPRHIDSTRVTVPVSRPKPVGWLYPTTYIATHTRREYPTGWYNFKNGTDWYSASGVLNGGFANLYQVGGGTLNFSDTSMPPENLYNAALTRAYLKIRNERLNVAMLLAERTRTANLVTLTCHRLITAYRSVRKGKFRKAARALSLTGKGAASRDWLEWTYGWAPLLGTVHDAVSVISQRNVWDLVVTGKGVERVVTKNSGVIAPFGSSGPLQSQWTETVEKSYFVRLDYVPANDFVAALRSFGLTNPMDLAWELLPYSFVVDWMVPVGDYLKTLDATAGLAFLSGSRSGRVSCYRVISKGPSRPTGNDFGSWSGKGRYVKVERNPFTGPPSTQLYVNLQGASLTRMTSALALLRVAFLRT